MLGSRWGSFKNGKELHNSHEQPMVAKSGAKRLRKSWQTLTKRGEITEIMSMFQCLHCCSMFRKALVLVQCCIVVANGFWWNAGVACDPGLSGLARLFIFWPRHTSYGNLQIWTHSDPGFLPLLEISWEEWSLADASKQAEDVFYGFLNWNAGCRRSDIVNVKTAFVDFFGMLQGILFDVDMDGCFLAFYLHLYLIYVHLYIDLLLVSGCPACCHPSPINPNRKQKPRFPTNFPSISFRTEIYTTEN